MKLTPKFEQIHTITSKASLLSMALMMVMGSCGCDDKSEESEGPDIELTSTKTTNVAKKSTTANIKVHVAVKKGELDPSQWTITTKDLKGKCSGNTDSTAKVTSDQDTQILSKVAKNFSNVIKQADGKKDFEVELKTDRTAGFGGTSTTDKTCIETVSGNLLLTGEVLDKNGKKATKSFDTKLEMEVEK